MGIVPSGDILPSRCNYNVVDIESIVMQNNRKRRGKVWEGNKLCQYVYYLKCFFFSLNFVRFVLFFVFVSVFFFFKKSFVSILSFISTVNVSVLISIIISVLLLVL